MTVALEGLSGQQHAPAALYPREIPGTPFTGGWVCRHIGLEKLKERDNLEDVVLDGRIMFNES